MPVSIMPFRSSLEVFFNYSQASEVTAFQEPFILHRFKQIINGIISKLSAPNRLAFCLLSSTPPRRAIAFENTEPEYRI